MHYEKGLIVLTANDLDLVSQCPFSVILTDRFKDNDECVRCNAFSKLAHYCFKRSSKNTNTISDKHLKEKYDRILYKEGIDLARRRAMIRSDGPVLADILNLSSEYKPNIDNVNPSITVNFGRFTIQDKLDAILCMDSKFYILKFMCSEHPPDGPLSLSYKMLAGSLWIRNEYDVSVNGMCFIQFSEHAPLIKFIDVTLTTEQIKQSVQSIIDILQPEKEIKHKKEFTLKDFESYKVQQLTKLARRFGQHCWNCQEPTCFKS